MMGTKTKKNLEDRAEELVRQVNLLHEMVVSMRNRGIELADIADRIVENAENGQMPSKEQLRHLRERSAIAKIAFNKYFTNERKESD
jgi:translation initiation factor IF-2